MAKPNFTLPNKPAIKSGSILSYNYTDDFTFVPAPLTFNRDSAATRVNEKGLIEDVGYFGPELVQNGDFEQIGNELITNGDFSDGTTGWVKGLAPSATQEVVNGALVMYSGSASDFSNALSRTDTPQGYNGRIYKLELNRSNFINGTLGYLRLDGVYDASNIISFGAGTSTIYFTAYRDFTHVRFYAASAESGYTIDNVSVKEVGQNWAFGTGWSIEDGVASCDGNGNLDQIMDITNGNRYKVSFTILNSTQGLLGTYLSGGFGGNFGNGTHAIEITGGSASSYDLRFVPISSFTGSITNISVIEVLGDKPRIDYSDSLTEPSLLLEPQSTNLITYSEDFSGWNSYQVTSNTTASPSGSTVYFLDFEDARMFPTTSISSSTTYTSSIYLKANKVANVKIRNARDQDTVISLTTDWVRYEVTAISNSSSTNALLIDARFSQGLGASGLEIALWGAQVEALSYSTSYIPTAGSTATRLGETAINAGDVNVFNSEEGVLYLEAAALHDSGHRYISVNNSNITNRITIEFYPNSETLVSRLTTNGVQKAFLVANNIVKTNMNKIAVRYYLNNFSFWVNGNKISEDLTDVPVPIGLNSLDFKQGNNSGDFHGKVKNIQVFNKALTDRELEILTIQ